MGGASTHILRAFIMSFGGPARAKHVAAAAAPTLAICWVMHQSTLRSGLQPATMSDEWQAASVGYLLARSTEANPDGPKILCDPIRNTMPNVESGRAVRWKTTKDLKNPWEGK